MGEVRRRRPWLAVLLALVISGLGHAYLRRWGRALGWYVAITATLVFLVPDAAVNQLFGGSAPPLGDILPALIVIVASVADAYILAVRNNREYERQAARKASPGVDQERGGWSEDPPETPDATADAEMTAIDCPSCGRETDPDIDFCHWCTEPLPGAGDTDES